MDSEAWGKEGEGARVCFCFWPLGSSCGVPAPSMRGVRIGVRRDSDRRDGAGKGRDLRLGASLGGGSVPV